MALPSHWFRCLHFVSLPGAQMASFTEYRVLTSGTPSAPLVAANEIAQAAYEFIADQLTDYMNEAMHYIATRVTYHADGVGYGGEFNLSTAGAQTGDPMPNYVSGTVSVITDIVGNKGRGRRHIPGVSEIHSSGNGHTDTGLGKLLVLATQMNLDLVADGCTWQAGHYMPSIASIAMTQGMFPRRRFSRMSTRRPYIGV